MFLVKPGFSPTKLLVAASLSCASMVSVPTPAVAACQAGEAGCVLPVGREPPPPVTTSETRTTPVYEDVDGKKSWLPIILVVLALAAAGYFLFLDDDEPDSP